MRRSLSLFALLTLASACRPSRVAHDAGTTIGAASVHLPTVTDTALEAPPRDAIEVIATPDRVEIGGVSVTLVGHQIPTEVLQGGVNGLLVLPLTHLPRPASRTALIRADRTLPAGVMVRVLYTLSQQDVATFAFLASPQSGPEGAITVHLPGARSRVARPERAETALRALAALMTDAATNAAPTPPAPSGPPTLRMVGGEYVVRADTVVLQPDCASFQTSGVTLHPSGAPGDDQRQIRRCLLASRSAPATHDAMGGEVIVVTVAPDETYDSMVQRLAMVRESHAGARDLYTDPALAVVR